MAAGVIHKCSVFCKRPWVTFILGSFASEFITYPFLHPLWNHVEPLISIQTFIESFFN